MQSVSAMMILIFAALLIYSIRRIYQFYWFQDGYVVETIYSGTLDDNFSIFESGEYEEY